MEEERIELGVFKAITMVKKKGEGQRINVTNK